MDEFVYSTLTIHCDTLTQIIDCASWLAICVHFSRTPIIWLNQVSRKPDSTIFYEDLVSDKINLELIKITLNRGLFTQIGGGRFKFFHKNYEDYLVAFALNKFIAPLQWPALLFTRDNKGILIFSKGVASWLATLNDNFLDEVLIREPELLLSSNDIIQNIGKAKLCNAILSRADNLSYRQRHLVATSKNLFRLNSPDTLTLISDYIQDKSKSNSTFAFVFELVQALKIKEVSSLLIQFVLDSKNDLRNRIKATCVLAENNTIDPAIKKFLSFNVEEDPEDVIKGNALDCLWPNQLTPIELCENLTQPRSIAFGKYHDFLKAGLPHSFKKTLNENNAITFLAWAEKYISEKEPLNSLGKLARYIFTFCWFNIKWNEGMIDLLTQIYWKNTIEFISPFIEKSRNDDEEILSIEIFNQNKGKRYEVIKKLIKDYVLDEHAPNFLRVNQPPLHTIEDFEWFLNQTICQKDEIEAKKWMRFVHYYLFYDTILKFESKLKELHFAHPYLIEKYDVLKNQVIESKAKNTLAQLEFENSQKNFKEEQDKDKNIILNQIKVILQEPIQSVKKYVWVSYWLDLQDGGEPIIDIQKTECWNILTTIEKENFVDGANFYLTNYEINPTASNNFNPLIAQSLLLLYLQRINNFQTLNKLVWENCTVEFINTFYMNEDLEALKPVLDHLNQNFRDIARNAFFVVLAQQLESDVVSIFRVWKNWFTETLINEIIEYLKKIDLKKQQTLIRELIQIKKYNEVKIYLDTFFIDKQLGSFSIEHYKLYDFAFYLNPEKYIDEIVQFLNENSSQGKVWIEAIVMNDRFGFNAGILSCKPKDVSKIYIWLNFHYPAETRPEHLGAYHPTPLDEIHMLKIRILNILNENQADGCIDALEMIIKRSRNLEGSTVVDCVFLGMNGFSVFIEAKVLSDISYLVTYDEMRNQMARNIDAMLEETLSDDNKKFKKNNPMSYRNESRTLFLLLTPRLFKDNPQSRFYGYKYHEYKTRPETIGIDLPHRKLTKSQCIEISNRIGWATWEDFHEINKDYCKWLV